MARCKQLQYICPVCGTDKVVLQVICKVPTNEETCDDCGGELLKVYIKSVGMLCGDRNYSHEG